MIINAGCVLAILRENRLRGSHKDTKIRKLNLEEDLNGRLEIVTYNKIR